MPIVTTVMDSRIQWAVNAANGMNVDMRPALCELLREIAHDAKTLPDEYRAELAHLGIEHTDEWSIVSDKVANLSIDEIADLTNRMIGDEELELPDEFEIIALTDVVYHLDASPTAIAYIITAMTCDYDFDGDTFMERFAKSLDLLYEECPNIARRIPYAFAPFLIHLQHDKMSIVSRHALMKIYEDIKTCGAFSVTGKINITDSHDDPFVEEIKIADAQTGITCKDILDICTRIDEMINHAYADITHTVKFRVTLRYLVNLALLSVNCREDILTHLVTFNWCDVL